MFGPGYSRRRPSRPPVSSCHISQHPGSSPAVDTLAARSSRHRPSASTTTAEYDSPSPSHRRRPSRGPSANAQSRLSASQVDDDGGAQGSRSYAYNPSHLSLPNIRDQSPSREAASGIPMSLSRSPSPLRGGGWASPGLNDGSLDGRISPRKPYAESNGGVSWATAKAKSDAVNSGFSTRGQGFFARHVRKMSQSLPSMLGGPSPSSHRGRRRTYSDKEKLGRGSYPRGGGLLNQLRTFIGSVGRRMKMRALLVLVVVIGFVLFWATREYIYTLRRGIY